MRHLLSKFGVVVAATLSAVAAADQEEVLDITTLDGFDDLIGHAEYRVMTETDQNLLAWSFCNIGAGQSLVDDRTKVEAVDVSYVGPCGATPCEESVFIGFGRFLNAVGVKDDRTGELGQFFGLILPGAAEVAGKVGVFFQPRIAMGWQHFTVGIDVDAFAFGLLEQLFEHFQVVTGHQNTLAGLGSGIDRGRHGMAVVIDMALIEQAHHGQVVLAALHG